MLVARSMDPRWLSNSWLLADRQGGHALLVDTGGPSEPLLESLDQWGCALEMILLTHHHPDHVAHTDAWRGRAPVFGPQAEADLLPALDRELGDGEELRLGSGPARIRCLHTPGHTKGQMAFVVGDFGVFTGDTLFRGCVGGTVARGHTTYQDLKASVMEVLMGLPDGLRVLPGHCDESSIGEERATNPFIQLWDGRRPPANEPVHVAGRRATLLLEARDYDGGTKCAVAYGEGGSDVVPGSRVQR